MKNIDWKERMSKGLENFLAKEKYCPNCKQNVCPTRSLAVLILEIVGGIILLFWVLQLGGLGQFYVPIAFILIVFTFFTPARKKCPICKTPWKNLKPKK